MNGQQYHKRTLGVEGVSFIPFQPNYIILNTAIQPAACPLPARPRTPSSLGSRVSGLGSRVCTQLCLQLCLQTQSCCLQLPWLKELRVWGGQGIRARGARANTPCGT